MWMIWQTAIGPEQVTCIPQITCFNQMDPLKTIPILGKNPLGHAKIFPQKTLTKLHFKRLYLSIRQSSPWKATLVMDLTTNPNAKDPETLDDFSAYLAAKEKLSELLITSKNAFGHLQARWISELGHQPDRLRIIYGKDQDFMEYNIKLTLLEREKVMIHVR